MSAPSFSSFQAPSFSSFPDLSTDDSKAQGSSDKSKRKDKKHRKDKPSRSSESHKHRHANDGYDKRHSAERSQHIKPETDLEVSSKLYYVDRRGDPLNISYGGLHTGDIPKHRLVDRRRILGLDKRWVVYHRGGKVVEVAFGTRHKVAALTDSSSRALLALPPKRFVTSKAASKDQELYPENADGFVRLGSSNSRGQHDLAPSHPLDSEASSSEESASDNDSDEEEEGSNGISLTAHQATLKSLEEKLQSCPFSVTLWIELLERSISAVPLASKNAAEARADISVSILSRALKAHEDNSRSFLLLLRYLRAGEQIWDEDKCRSEWERALRAVAAETGPVKPASTTYMWLQWLGWRTRSSGRGVSGLMQVLERAKRVLTESLSSVDLELALVMLMWRTVVFLQSAGLYERATAVLQAQAELTFRCPNSMKLRPLSERLDSLEEFWESESPRFGEDDARGWVEWISSMEDSVSSPAKAQPALEVPLFSAGSDPYQAWSAQEKFLDKHHTLPSRTTDSEADEDPFATVLFSDIRPFLFDLSHASSRRAFKHVCISGLGLRIPRISSLLFQHQPTIENDTWSGSQLASGVYLDSLLPVADPRSHIQADAQSGVLVGREREYKGGCFGPVKEWGWGVCSPLELRPGGKSTCIWSKEDVQGVPQPDLVRGFFAQLRESQDEEWDILALEFEAQLDVKRALKLSKTMLANSRQSLRRWCAHAQLERLRGKIPEARKVFNAALASASADTPCASLALHEWAEMEWLAGQPDESLRVIQSFVCPDSQSTGAIALLRVRGRLEELASRPNTHTDRWVELHALFELLTTKTIEPALAVFDKHLSTSTRGSLAHERWTLQALYLIYNYTKVLRHPLPPEVLRSRANEAIAQYPDNTIAFGLFLEGEKGQGVWGRVGAVMGDNYNGTCVGGDKGLMRRVQEVWAVGWEKGRWEREIEKTRRGLGGAVSAERTRESATLWRIYLEFEIRNGQLKRAKSLLYRAVRECPLSKDLYLIAFGPLRSVFTRHELDSFADTMAERGVRIRRSLEDMTSGHGMEEIDSAEVDRGDDEIEFNADELRRLKPY